MSAALVATVAAALLLAGTAGATTPNAYEPHFIDAGLGVISVAVDSNYVYWTNTSTSTIGRANLDGSDVNPDFIGNAPYAYGIAVDSGHIYWSEEVHNTIGRANIDGRGADHSFITGVHGPAGVAVDSGHVYWADYGSSSIGRANLDGSNPDNSFITGATYPVGLAVDAGHIYWGNGYNGQFGGIGRANIDGSDVNQSWVAQDGSYYHYGIFSDGTNVYWTSNDKHWIGRTSVDGSSSDPSFANLTQPSYAWVSGVAAADDHLYYVDNSGGYIGRASLVENDTTPPALSLPGDITTDATSPAGAAVTYAATATDDTDGTVTPSCSPASGSTFPIGTTTVSCSATDAAGNVAKGSFTVTVGPYSGPATVTVPATGTGTPPNWTFWTSSGVTIPAGDEVTVTATASWGICQPFSYGCPLFTLNGPDGTGGTWSSSYGSFTPGSLVGSVDGIHWFQLGSGPFTVEGPGTLRLAMWDVPTSYDGYYNNAGSATVSISAPQPVDSTPPVLSLPSDITAEATGPDGATVAYSASANDNVDGAVTPDCAPASGSTFPLGTTKVSCSATDAAGNTSSGSFTVTVEDTTAPAIALSDRSPAANAAGWNSGPVALSWTCTDAVSGSWTVSTTVSGEGAAQAATGVCTDAAGNSSSDTQSVSIDTTAPTLSPSVSPNPVAVGSSATADAGATDSLSGIASSSCDSVSTATAGVFSVTCTATDNAGNTASATTSYTVYTPLGSGPNECTGIVGGSGGSLDVPAGASCVVLPGTSVTGDVTVAAGGSLTAADATFGHDLHVDHATSVSLANCTVAHDLQLVGVSGDLSVTGSSVGHDLHVVNNGGAIDVAGVVVGHDLQVDNNTGGGIVADNSAAHDLSIQNNSGGLTVGSGNTAGHSLTVRKNS